MNTERDKFLTEAMGECWHNLGEKYTTEIGWCIKCCTWHKHNHNFSIWSGFGKLWEWAQKQEWWKSFVWVHGDSTRAKYRKESTFSVKFLHPDRFADALYQFLKERP